MKQCSKLRFVLAGALAGMTNGLFGGGGGSVLVPLLTRYCRLDQREAFATSVAVILPLCVLSAAIYLLRGGLDWAAALPYYFPLPAYRGKLVQAARALPLSIQHDCMARHEFGASQRYPKETPANSDCQPRRYDPRM